MMAFILAALIFVLGACAALFSGFAAEMSDSQSAANDVRSSVWTILFGSWVLSAIVASTHFLHVSW